jgi:hypothetical protein
MAPGWHARILQTYRGDGMSLDFYLERTQPTRVFDCNITHNLTKMAIEAGIYEVLWRPDEYGYKKAEQIVPILRKGLELLESDPTRFEKFNSPNGWGMYEHFVPFVKSVLAACEEYPDADIRVSI